MPGLAKVWVQTITTRLNADHTAYAPPNGATWIPSGVAAILGNPNTPGIWSTAASA
jgi:hypothetical protein